MYANSLTKKNENPTNTYLCTSARQPQQLQQPLLELSIILVNRITQVNMNNPPQPSPFYYPPPSGIASCVGTAGTVMRHLHLTRPCYLAIGRVLIWVMCPDWFEELYNEAFPIIISYSRFDILSIKRGIISNAGQSIS